MPPVGVREAVTSAHWELLMLSLQGRYVLARRRDAEGDIIFVVLVGEAY